MNITIIYATGRKAQSCTYNIAQLLIKKLLAGGELFEFQLPRDMPHICIGCYACIKGQEQKCGGAAALAPILNAMEQSELIIFCTPTYVFHVPGQMKTLLDHFAYRWMIHRPDLVYCDNAGKKGEKELDKILAGTKTMVVRGAAGRKIPHSRVFAGERLYFMEKGSASITATATVKEVQNFVKLSDEEIAKVLADNQKKLNLSDKQITRWHKKCLCFVEFESVEEIAPLAFDHQGNMDDWLIIDKIEDVVVGTSIPYNYEKSKF